MRRLPLILAMLLLPWAPARAQVRVGNREGEVIVEVRPITEDPNDIRRQRLESYRDYLSAADAALAQGQLALAKRRADQAGTVAVDDAGRAAVVSLYREINDAALLALAQADAAYVAEDYDAALRTYGNLALTMGRLPAARLARQKLEAAENDPAVRQAAREARAGAMLGIVESLIESQRDTGPSATSQPRSGPTEDAPPPAEIVAAMTPERQDRVLDVLETLADQYADTSAGAEAMGLIEQLHAQPGLIESVRAYRQERTIRADFARARQYAQSRLYNRAAELYRELIEQYPDSDYARRASAELGRIETLLETTPLGQPNE